MSVEPLTIVPSGTVVRLSILLPKQPARDGESFVWTAPRHMTATEARGEIGRDLMTAFLNTFLPIE